METFIIIIITLRLQNIISNKIIVDDFSSLQKRSLVAHLK